MDRRSRALTHYEWYERSRASHADPPTRRQRNYGRKGPVHHLANLWFWGMPLWITLFVFGLSNPDPVTQQTPWYGGIAALIIVFPIGLLIMSMWWRMVSRFSRNPIAQLLFGGLTLLLMASGIGLLIDLILYSWVMSGQPDLITNEPLAPGPQRDVWLAARRSHHHHQTVNIDARQVHVHH